MKRFLLTHGFFLAEDAKEQQIMRPYPPLGILYISSHLRAQGFAPELYDSTFGSREDLYRLIENASPGVLGIYGNLLTRTSVVSILQRAKQAGWLVVLGGPEPANYAEEYLDAGADLIVAGEAELALEELCAADFAEEAWSRVAGLIFRREGRVQRTGPGRTISSLDAQPWPDREQIDLNRYLQAWRAHHGMGSVSLITARGCPFHCAWCSHSVFGKTHRRRSARGVADEVEFLLDRYQPEMLWFADDVFTIHHGWLREYTAEVRRRGCSRPFECITRADRLNAEAADLLAELGCMRVWIGSESGSARILNAMERGVTPDQVYGAVELCRARGIQTGMFLMWGYEGEEIADIELTVDHVKRCAPDVFLTTISYPIKGTPYFETVRNRLTGDAAWGYSTDRDYRIAGRHSREFYRQADLLLKSEMEPERDAGKIAGARRALHALAEEVEA
jgi:radical SAM superfamily enzyme YgiQ (UPF0313 family)